MGRVMQRWLIGFLALAAGCTAAAAAEYECNSLANDPQATMTFTVTHSSGAYAVTQADVTIGGYGRYSTGAQGGAKLERVNSVAITDTDIAFGLGPTYDSASGDTVLLHVVTLGDDKGITAGVLSLPGEGAWPVSCDIK